MQPRVCLFDVAQLVQVGAEAVFQYATWENTACGGGGGGDGCGGIFNLWGSFQTSRDLADDDEDDGKLTHTRVHAIFGGAAVRLKTTFFKTFYLP